MCYRDPEPGRHPVQDSEPIHPKVRSHRSELRELCRRYRVRRLKLFGSAAGEQDAIGNVGFLVEFDELDPDAYADAYFGLLEGLKELFDWPVDLVMTSGVSNPYFLRDIARDRTVVYAA